MSDRSKFDLNYIHAHKAIFEVISEIDIDASKAAIIHALFHTWNKSGFSKTFRVSREEIMRLSCIRSQKTYYKHLNQLKEMNLIGYEPSKNPEVASKFDMSIFYLCRGSSLGSCEGSCLGSCRTALYKQVNNSNIKPKNLKTSFLEKKADNHFNDSDSNKSIEHPFKEKDNLSAPHKAHTYFENSEVNQKFLEYINERNSKTKYKLTETQVANLVEQVNIIELDENKVDAIRSSITCGYKMIKYVQFGRSNTSKAEVQTSQDQSNINYEEGI